MKLFSKEMTRTFQTEIIECPDCAFEFSSLHEQSGAKGLYSCPLCEATNLETENAQLRNALEEIKSFANDVKEFNYPCDKIHSMACKGLGEQE